MLLFKIFACSCCSSYIFYFANPIPTVILSEPEEGELGQKGEINGWSSNMSYILVCTNAVHELTIMGHHRETSALSVLVAAAFQAVKE